MADPFFDMLRILEEDEERFRNEIMDLGSRSKPLYDLLVTERFTVEDVIAETYTSITQYPEMIGGRSAEYTCGFTSKLSLGVSPENLDIPVRNIDFEGFSVVRAGDYISAQIPRYVEKKVGRGIHSGPFEKDMVFYMERDLHKKESAIELAILSADGLVLRRDRSVDYKKFVKR